MHIFNKLNNFKRYLVIPVSNSWTYGSCAYILKSFRKVVKSLHLEKLMKDVQHLL